jgi:LCP family protein required for cell wall assembly
MVARPRHQRPSTRRTWLQRTLIATSALLALSCFAAASAVGYVYLRYGDLNQLPLTLHRVETDDPQNYLVVGSDTREVIDKSDPNQPDFIEDGFDTTSRTDTIMIARIDPRARTIALLSFPRDLWIPIAGTDGEQRINTAYAHSPQTLIDTIEENFGIPVNHYIEVDFTAFQSVVDALGGIALYFDTPLRDRSTGLALPGPGCFTLDGAQALAFARSRHMEYKTSSGWKADPSADLGRISRQQFFVRTAMEKVFDTNVFDFPRQLKLLDSAHDNVTVDSGLGVSELHTLADQFRDFSVENLATYSLPVTLDRTDGGASIVRLVDGAARPILNQFRGLSPGELREADVSVTVLNGTGKVGEASAVRGALESVGFEVDGTGNAPEHADRSTVRYAPGSLAAADLVARHLTNGAVLIEDADAAPGSVTLTVGPEFTTVMQSPFAPTSTTTTATTATNTGATTPTTVAPTTTTTVIGHVPGAPPPGVTC